MNRYYLKAYNSKTSKLVEASDLVIDSVFEQINWCGIALKKGEKQMIQDQINQFYDFEFTIRGVTVRVCFSEIRQTEIDRGFN